MTDASCQDILKLAEKHDKPNYLWWVLKMLERHMEMDGKTSASQAYRDMRLLMEKNTGLPPLDELLGATAIFEIMGMPLGKKE
jgi:hypothetical protein